MTLVSLEELHTLTTFLAYVASRYVAGYRERISFYSWLPASITRKSLGHSRFASRSTSVPIASITYRRLQSLLMRCPLIRRILRSLACQNILDEDYVHASEVDGELSS